MPSLRAHVLQHVPFEGPGSIASWLARRGAACATSRLDQGGACPAATDYDLLVIMGGPMGVHDELPWLEEERACIRAAVDAGKAVLGICLGAQQIAAALGATVVRGPAPEIGWFPVETLPEAPAWLRLPPELPVFHWHRDTFQPPAGAVRLARSTACAEQGFQLGERVVGLQFHLEMEPTGVAALVEHFGAQLRPADHVQSAETILAAPAERYRACAAAMDRLLERLVD